MRRNSRSVRLSPYLIPKLETISDTARPAPWRRACMRMNQLPIPARGARTARFGRRTPPSVQGSVITEERLALAVALPHDPQAGKRQQVVDLVDLVAEGRDRARQAAGGDRRCLCVQLLADAPHDSVDLAREAVDDA